MRTPHAKDLMIVGFCSAPVLRRTLSDRLSFLLNVLLRAVFRRSMM